MMLADAAGWLSSMTLGHLSVPVLYRTADGEEKSVRAVVGSTVFQADDGYGVVADFESRDFIVAAAELPEEPGKGDAIVWRGMMYEVMAPRGGPCWRWSDAYHTMKRIHTKETGEDGDGQQ